MKSVSEQELNLVTSSELVTIPKSAPTSTIVERPHLEPLLDKPDEKTDNGSTGRVTVQ